MEEKLNRIDSQNTQIIESLEQLQLTMDQLLRLVLSYKLQTPCHSFERLTVLRLA